MLFSWILNYFPRIDGDDDCIPSSNGGTSVGNYKRRKVEGEHFGRDDA